MCYLENNGAVEMAVAEEMTAMALRLHRQGQPVALATVMATWGSAPRPVGAQMLICADGSFHGSVSGGCVEGAVVLEALEAFLAADSPDKIIEAKKMAKKAWVCRWVTTEPWLRVSMLSPALMPR